MLRQPIARWILVALLASGGSLFMLRGRPSAVVADEGRGTGPHRSPIALARSADGSRLLTANQTAGSVSLIDPAAGAVLDELATGSKPSGVALSGDGTRGVVAHWYGYDVAILAIRDDRLEVEGRVEVGPEPRGVAMTGDGSTAFVAVGASDEVVRIDLDERAVTGRLGVGREPRGVALGPDERRLLVGNARDGSVSLVDLGRFEVSRTVPIKRATNLRQVAFGADGDFGYVANMENRGMATTRNNIDQGWVLGQRLTRIALDDSGDYATQSLDPQGAAAGDVHGVAVSGDGRFLAVSAGGTHEVLLFRLDGERLPWRTNGARDLIHHTLLYEGDDRFRRVETGGRPTELAFAPDSRTLYVANYFGDAVQVIDAEEGRLAGSIGLGGPAEPSLARRGEMLFHDADRSFNQWYSCNTCHSDGHTNRQLFDTMNDGWHDFRTNPELSKKIVPTLRDVVHTGPWTWHGWQESLDQAMVESFTKSMQGPPPSGEEVEALVAFLGTLEHPPNPHLPPDGSLSEAAGRGREVFRSPRAACNTCHGGPYSTDGGVHLVGLEERRDVYKGYNAPSLIGLYDRAPYLHDGRAADLRELLTEHHAPDDVTGLGALTEREREDLIAYLLTL